MTVAATTRAGSGAARTGLGTRAARTGGGRGADTAVGVGSHVLLIAWSVVVIVPLLWVLMSSFKTTKEILADPFSPPTTFHFENYVQAWSGAGIGLFFLNTIIVVGVSLVITMLLGAMCAYVLARFKFFGARAIYYLMLAGLTFPIFLAAVPLFQILNNIHLLNTLPGLILSYVAFALPFTVFFLYSFFQGLPNEIYEAAQVDGASEWRTFFQVMLPMAVPGMASVSIFNFLGMWNQYLLPITLNAGNPDGAVLTQGIAQYANSMMYDIDYGPLFAAIVLTVIPVVIIYLIFQRQLQGSVSQGTSK